MAGPKQPDLVKYRIESAEERLEAARVLMKRKLFKDAISRAYYAIFQAARAALATKKLDAHKHSGVLACLTSTLSSQEYLPKIIAKSLAVPETSARPAITMTFTW